MHGARIVAEVVGDEGTFNEWRSEMDGMAGRIKVRHPDHHRPLPLHLKGFAWGPT